MEIGESRKILVNEETRISASWGARRKGHQFKFIGAPESSPDWPPTKHRIGLQNLMHFINGS